MACQLPPGAEKGPMEEAFERLEAALQRLPRAEHTPEMLLLAASHGEFRVAVHYAWDAMAAARGEGPPLSQDDVAQASLRGSATKGTAAWPLGGVSAVAAAERR